MQTNTIKVFQECIRGISSELVLWIHKPPMFSSPGPSLSQKDRSGELFWSRGGSFLSAFPRPILQRERRLSQPNLLLYIWMCGERRWSGRLISAQVQRHWPWLTCSRRWPYITEGQPTLWRCMPAFRSWFVACGGQRFTAPPEKSSKEWAAPSWGHGVAREPFFGRSPSRFVMSFNGAEDGWNFLGWTFRFTYPFFPILDIHLPHNATIGFVWQEVIGGAKKVTLFDFGDPGDKTTEPSLSLSLPLCSSDLFVLCSAT